MNPPHSRVFGVGLDGGEGLALVTQVERVARRGFAPRQGLRAVIPVVVSSIVIVIS